MHPHKLGTGLKLWEQLANHPGTGAALIVLCAAEREMRGGGDLTIDHALDALTHKKTAVRYLKTAKRTIGRWAGDRIALVGDYAENEDMKSFPHFKQIYHACHGKDDTCADSPHPDLPCFNDITEDVCAVIEHELEGKFSGTGWRNFKYNCEVDEVHPPVKADMVIMMKK